MRPVPRWRRSERDTGASRNDGSRDARVPFADRMVEAAEFRRYEVDGYFGVPGLRGTYLTGPLPEVNAVSVQDRRRATRRNVNDRTIRLRQRPCLPAQVSQTEEVPYLGIRNHFRDRSVVVMAPADVVAEQARGAVEQDDAFADLYARRKDQRLPA